MHGWAPLLTVRPRHCSLPPDIDAPGITFVAETGSTNADLLAEIRAGHPREEGAWHVADRQNSGRGRHGRQWLDAPGNFMGSTLVRLRAGDPVATTLSLVAALAVYEVARTRLTDPSALICKWPNDVLLGGAKFCGILLEREGDNVVVGIGVNLAAAPQIEGRETRALGATERGRDAFARDLAAIFARELTRWREDGLQSLFPRWLERAHPVGTRLATHDAQGSSIEGTFSGLAADGSLQLALASGQTRVIAAGEVTMERQ